VEHLNKAVKWHDHNMIAIHAWLYLEWMKWFATSLSTHCYCYIISGQQPSKGWKRIASPFRYTLVGCEPTWASSLRCCGQQRWPLHT